MKKVFGYALFILLILGFIYVAIFFADKNFGSTKVEGSSGSSYSTAESGYRAWSDLLSLNGYNIVRDRGSVTLPKDRYSDIYTYDNLNLDKQTEVVVLLGGALPVEESKEVIEFVNNGGRLITDNPIVLEDILGDKAEFEIEGSKIQVPNNNVEGLEGITSVESSGYGLITVKPSSSSDAVLVPKTQTHPNDPSDLGYADSIQASTAIFQYGAGDVIALIDSSPISNAYIAKSDNALFSLRIAGKQGNTITFIEGIHGYDEKSGFAGLPLSWQIAIVGLLVAFVLFGCAQGRRFGMSEESDRNLGPRRIYFAHAIAYYLKKSNGKS